jgi:hypothetical protein
MCEVTTVFRHYILFVKKTSKFAPKFWDEPNLRFMYVCTNIAVTKSDIKPAFWVRWTDKSKKAFTEPLIYSYLATSLFQFTNRGFYLFGRRFVFNSIYVTKYAPFLIFQHFKHSTLLELV